MAYDASPRFEARPEPLPLQKLPIDWTDVVLRAVVLVPLIGLYTWWAGATIWRALTMLWGAWF